MCGEAKCSKGASEGCCNLVYDEDSGPQPELPKYPAAVKSNPKAFECVCFYVPSPGFQAQQYQETYKYDEKPRPLRNNLQNEWKDLQGAPFRDLCDLPPQDNLTIPYPRPAPSVELRGGQIYSGCQCVKRDGLQHDCPRTGCQGRAPCMAYPAPQCVPSGNAPPPSEGVRHREPGRRRQAGPSPSPQQKAVMGYTPVDDRYIHMGRRGYRENPPVKQRTRVPCEEHRKTRC